jgi:hypothetical protein
MESGGTIGDQMVDTNFKTCKFCTHPWPTRQEFLGDPALKFIGYQAFVHEGVLGLFLFNHEPCGTTLALSAKLFADLHGNRIYESREDFDEAAPECLSSSSGRECPVACECGFVRKVIGHINEQAAGAG